MLRGELRLLPSERRLVEVAADHELSIKGRMFFVNRPPDSFDQIVERLSLEQKRINQIISSGLQ